MRRFLLVLSAIASIAFQAPSASAVPIDYIFRGTGDFELNGVAFSNTAFRVDLFGDTANATVGSFPDQSRNFVASATFTTGATTVTLLGDANGVIVNTGNLGFPAIVFAQLQPSPVFVVAEGLLNAVFAAYDLTTAFPLTSGDPSFIVQTFLTSGGDLTFRSAESMSFEAVVSDIPIPGALPLFASGLGVLGLIAHRRRRKAVAA